MNPNQNRSIFDPDDDSHAHYWDARPSVLLRGVRITMLTFLLVSFAVVGAGALWIHNLKLFSDQSQDFSTIIKHRALDNSIVYDRKGHKIGEFFSSFHIYIPYKDLPPHFVNALLAIEDRNFWSHKGFDPKGILRAVYVKLKRGTTRQGASTLTQQVVRHFLLPSERTIQRKLKEIALAYQLEQRISKQKIIEIYANSLFLGNGSYGIGAAARRYFGKEIGELEAHESALIAGLYQSPSRYNPVRFPKRAKARQKQVIRALYDWGKVDRQTARSLLKRPLRYHRYRPLNGLSAPYFVDYVREQANKILVNLEEKEGTGTSVNNQGLRIYTTLDLELQKVAERAIRDAEPELVKAEEIAPTILNRKTGKREPPTVEASLLSLDPRTGHILAMVGGRDYQSSQFNRPVQALRSPGSAFKPIVYSLALQSRWKWSDVIFVSPININSYRPRNPTEDYLSETTLLRAFYRSMNTPTVELGQHLGLKEVLAHAEKLGIRTPLKEEFGTMIGGSDVTMLDLGRVFGSFANGGAQVEPVAITAIKKRNGKTLYRAPIPKQRATRALSPQVSYLMTQGMQDVLRRGTGYRSKHLARWAAGKTGTANNATDNWFCGYTSNLTTIAWVGTDEHQPMHRLAGGAKTALPIWDAFVTEAIKIRKPRKFRRPPGVIPMRVHSRYGYKTHEGITMWFLRNQQPGAETKALEALSHLEEGTGVSYRDLFTH